MLLTEKDVRELYDSYMDEDTNDIFDLGDYYAERFAFCMLGYEFTDALRDMIVARVKFDEFYKEIIEWGNRDDFLYENKYYH